MSVPAAPHASSDEPRRPDPTLGRVLDDLGTTFLRPLIPVAQTSRRVGGVIVYDPLDEQLFSDGAMVLGVGLTPGPAVREVLALAGAHGASALVLREPAELDAETEAVAREQGVAILGLTRGASWAQLSAIVASILAEGERVLEAESWGGLPSGDLFTLANAIGALLDAPITIEDRSSRVLAFSGRQDEADPSRIETILERQVPARYSQMLTDAGFFKEMFSSVDPVHIELVVDDTRLKTRAAIAVRAGDEILGSIWAAVEEELSDERAAAMRDAAKLVALHLLRIRAGSDVERRLRADLLSTALEGGDGAGYALERLGLHDTGVVVFAAGVADDADGQDLAIASDREVQRQRVSDAIAMHLAAVHPQACAALIGDTIYGLLPVRDVETGEAQADRLAADFIQRIGQRTPIVIGISPVANGPGELARAYDSAGRALRVLLEQGPASSRAVLFSDVHVEALLLELRDKVEASGEQASGPVARLMEHDREHQTEFVDTLRTWLDWMGDVTSAAEAMYIHPNTFRYRLRRLAEVGDMDLSDPDVRFAAMLQLRILPRHQGD